MNSSTDSETTAFSCISCVAEKSEGVRQSDFRVQNLPASVSSSELSPHQMGGALAGEVRISNIELSGMDPERSDGCSLLGLMSVPSVPLLFDGTPNAVESAEDFPSEQCEGSHKRSTDTTDIVDVSVCCTMTVVNIDPHHGDLQVGDWADRCCTGVHHCVCPRSRLGACRPAALLNGYDIIVYLLPAWFFR